MVSNFLERVMVFWKFQYYIAVAGNVKFRTAIVSSVTKTRMEEGFSEKTE